MAHKVQIKLIDGSSVDLQQHFEGFCEEAESAGRHFKGYCSWEFDLSKEEDVSPEARGIYYMHGFADGDWGTEFDSHNFVSNEELEALKKAAGYQVTYKFPDKAMAMAFQEFLSGQAEQEWDLWSGMEDTTATYGSDGSVEFLRINE